MVGLAATPPAVAILQMVTAGAAARLGVRRTTLISKMR